MTGEIYYDFRSKTTFTATSATEMTFTYTAGQMSELLEIVDAGKYIYITFPETENFSSPLWLPVTVTFSRQFSPTALMFVFPYYNGTNVVWCRTRFNTSALIGTITF